MNVTSILIAAGIVAGVLALAGIIAVLVKKNKH